jgi:hypothetical protein
MTPEFMARLMRQVDALALAFQAVLPVAPHLRGKFAQIILGRKHGMGHGGNVSKLALIRFANAHAPPKFLYHPAGYDKHEEAILAFRSSPEIRLIMWVLVLLV